jgi:hypothetical protein
VYTQFLKNLTSHTSFESCMYSYEWKVWAYKAIVKYYLGTEETHETASQPLGRDVSLETN